MQLLEKTNFMVNQVYICKLATLLLFKGENGILRP